MDSLYYSDIKNIYGIDLSDYFIDKNSYNPTVFIHKKYLPKGNNNTRFEKAIDDHDINDKCQQFDYDKINNKTYETKIIDSNYRDPLVDQTIRFAKDIIPITIPPNVNSANPVYYTIKSCKKNKKKLKPQEYKLENKKDATFDKEQSKHTIGTLKQGKCKKNKDSISATSATHFSPNNTIDDIDEDQSLSYSLSDLSEQKHKREDCVQRSKKHNFQKIVASESFEAIATEYMQTPADSKIKIHLMNEKDKQLLCENIGSPVIKAVKKCFFELNHQNEYNIEMQNMNKTIRYHANKLDSILDKLTCIENKLELLTKPQLNTTIEINKASKLEELGQDILDLKEGLSSEEELACVNFSTKSRGKSTPVTVLSDKEAERDIKSVDNLARGENIPEYFKASTSHLGIKPERSNRIPARFCWTDVMKN